MFTKKRAIIAGASGVTGRALFHYLDTLQEWETLGIARRAPDFKVDEQFVLLDLLDRKVCEQQLSSLKDVTHIFFAAYIATGNHAGDVAPNLIMLKNIVEVIEKTSPVLKRVILIEGPKYYGLHLGPYKTPAKETDERQAPPNFYYDQEDFLREKSRNKHWDWSVLRPSLITGFALGTPMNILNLIAVYATLLKEMGLPLSFPGKLNAYNKIFEATDAKLLAKAMVWAATNELCSREAFNITNGDFFRWEHVWPKFATFFEMEYAAPQPLCLVKEMAGKHVIWQNIVKKYQLKPYRYEQLVQWGYGDAAFNLDYDIMSDTTKAHQAGFHEFIDSEEMFLRWFSELKKERIIP